MKILFVQKMNGISGSELYLMQLLPELKKRGYNVEVLIILRTYTEKNKPFINHLARYGIITHEIYGYRELSPALVYRISRLIKKEKYDIVQSNLVHADLWIACAKLFFNRKLKIVSVKHGFDEPYSAKYGNNPKHLWKSLFFWLQKFSGWFAKYNATVSKGLYDMYVNGKIVSSTRIRIVYYGLDLNEKELLVIDRKPAERFAIILGRLVKYKGHEKLIEAWQKVTAHNKDLNLYIIGGGNYEKELVGIVNKMELADSVKFLGYQPNPHQFIKDAEFMLVTSVWEGFGLIMLESWAHKKPLIVFDTPAMNEIVEDNKTGLIAKAFDTKQLAEKIICYFDNPVTAEKHGLAGYEKLYSYYTVKRMADEMVEIYKFVNPTSV